MSLAKHESSTQRLNRRIPTPPLTTAQKSRRLILFGVGLLGVSLLLRGSFPLWLAGLVCVTMGGLSLWRNT